MADSCSYVNPQGVRCGLPPHPSRPNDHEVREQITEPEPFCIKATDPFALSAIRMWIVEAEAHKIDREKILKAEQKFYEVKRWQREHGTRLPG